LEDALAEELDINTILKDVETLEKVNTDFVFD